MHDNVKPPQTPPLQEQPHQELELPEADEQRDHFPSLKDSDRFYVDLSYVSRSKFVSGSVEDGRYVYHCFLC